MQEYSDNISTRSDVALLGKLRTAWRSKREMRNQLSKNKTFSSYLSVLTGSLGLHRFYLYGRHDVGGWMYLATSALYFVVLMASFTSDSIAIAVASLFPIPAFVAAIEGLTIGLTDDSTWDRRYNMHFDNTSRSRWPLAVLLVLTLAATFTGFVASLARATDLLYTGGSFG